MAAPDAERTRQLYANLDAVADTCTCVHCKNYRTAWKRELFPFDLLAACAEIGIDPARAFETTALDFDGGLVWYSGQLPFYGIVSNERRPGDLRANPWLFSSHPYGSATFAEGLATIEFCVRVPWVLSESYE